jgi:copper transport protein
VVSAVPRELTLVFDEDVVPRYARVSVLTVHGQDLAGAPQVFGSTVSVPVRPGRLGSYTVRWRMVASNDGHATAGAYSFGVRTKPLPPAPVNGLDIPVAPQLLAWLQFVGIVLAGGTLTCRALVWAPAARLVREGQAPDAKLAIGAGVAGAVVGLHAGLLGFLVGAYPIVGSGPSGFVNALIEPIRAGTHLGQGWTLMTFAWFGVLALLVAAWVTPREREALLAGAGVLALGIAFDLSWASHPASRGTLALAADFLHLVAAALWVGGLVAVAILVVASRRLPSAEREAIARGCIVRFSRLVVPTVVIVASAGAYLAVRELPALSALLSSGYGITLLIKSAVVGGALTLGGYHRRVVVPRIAGGAPTAVIGRTLTLEMGFLLSTLVLAAVLSQTAPPT